MDELPKKAERTAAYNCMLDVEEAQVLISCMDKAAKQASDTVTAAVQLWPIREKLEHVVKSKGTG
tara:strand:+ start:1772 stop:1966 length:195 start_codon:yes stop_codon:yes gene_type:complete